MQDEREFPTARGAFWAIVDANWTGSEQARLADEFRYWFARLWGCGDADTQTLAERLAPYTVR